MGKDENKFSGGFGRMFKHAGKDIVTPARVKKAQDKWERDVRRANRVPVGRTTIRVQLKHPSDIAVLLHPDGAIEIEEGSTAILLHAEEARELIGRVMVHHSDLQENEDE